MEGFPPPLALVIVDPLQVRVLVGLPVTMVSKPILLSDLLLDSFTQVDFYK